MTTICQCAPPPKERDIVDARAVVRRDHVAGNAKPTGGPR